MTLWRASSKGKSRLLDHGLLLSPFGRRRHHSRASNREPLRNLLVRESDSHQFGGTFTALLTSLLLFSRFSDSHGSSALLRCCQPLQPLPASVASALTGRAPALLV